MQDIEKNTGDLASNATNNMQKLTDEHSNGILFAEEIIRIADEGMADELAKGIEKVHQYNLDELEAHLQHEEQTILGPLIQHHPEHSKLCIRIGKEHGLIRTLVEEMTCTTAKKDLADFGRILKQHTQLEDRELFPLVETLFTEEQMNAIGNFAPFQRKLPHLATPEKSTRKIPEDKQDWLSELELFVNTAGRDCGSIVLLPRFNPDLSVQIARCFKLELFDFQKEMMEKYGAEADSIRLVQMENSLRQRAEISGIVAHNVEALLCVKPEQQRRAWLQTFLNTDWPNTILLPIAIYQADAPNDHKNICDLELHRVPKHTETGATETNNLKYYIETRE